MHYISSTVVFPYLSGFQNNTRNDTKTIPVCDISRCLKPVAHTSVSKNVLPPWTKLELPQTPKRNKQKLAVHPQKPKPTLYSDMPTQQSSKTDEVESLFDRIL